MSTVGIAAKRYARALFEAANERGIVDQVNQELETAVKLVTENEEYWKFLEHPGISMEDKLSVLKQSLEKHVSELVLHTLQLLVQRHRQKAIRAVWEHYVKIAGEALGQARAIVSSPAQLSESEIGKIADTFGKLTGKTLQIQQVVEPSLLGGVQVRIGDRVYDGSLKTKLADMEKTIKRSQAQ